MEKQTTLTWFFQKKQKAAAFHPGKQFDWKTNGNLEGVFFHVDPSVCFSLRCHPNPLGEFLWQDVIATNSVEGVQFPAQNIPAKQFEPHIVCTKKENRMPKRILPQEKPEEWLKRHYSSKHHIYHFFVFLSSSSVSSLLSSLLLSNQPFQLVCWGKPWFLFAWRGQPRREFVKPIIYSLYLPGQGALRLVGVEKKLRFVHVCLRGILISKFWK